MDQKTGFAQWWRDICDKIGGFFRDIGGKIQDFFHISKGSSDGAAEQELDTATEAAPPAGETPDTALGKTGSVMRLIGLWLYRLRKVFMAIPVVWYALKLAAHNQQNLPEQVGLNLQVNGEYATVIDRSLAVYGPLGITAACLVLMMFSRRARYPWIISAFTLILPLLILFTNLYPQ